MSKFAIGFAQSGSPRNGTSAGPRLGSRTNVQSRINANVRRGFSFRRGYFTILGLLTLIAASSMSVALWRLFHFAH